MNFRDRVMPAGSASVEKAGHRKQFQTGEFDPGSERTLAAGLTHASLKEVYFLGGRVSNT